MNHLMRHLISLQHLTKAKSKSGQIATLLLLSLVIMLIFVMVTVNLGNVAVDATKIANAADSAVLQLASNLSTKARMLYEGLGNRYEKCQKTGYLALAAAVVAAIIVTVASHGAASPYAVAFVAAVAGGIGGAIAGTGWAQGAVTGAAVGFSIGSLGASFAADVEAGGSGIAGAGTELNCAGATFTFTVPVVVLTPAAAFAAAGLAATVYNASVQDKIPSTLLSQLQKDLSKLEEKDRFRESAFYTALTQVVDDPNVHADTDDINANTNTTEFISRFAWWWHSRLTQFAKVRNEQVAPLNEFLTEMRDFRDFAYQAYAGKGYAEKIHSSGYLERADYKWSVDDEGSEVVVTGADIGVVDGLIVGLLRSLHAFNFDTTMKDGSLIWKPGPAPKDVYTWADEECGSVEEGSGKCSPPPSSFDYLDLIADDLREMVGFMNGVVPPAFQEWVEMQCGNVNSGGCGTEDFWSHSWVANLQAQYNELIANSNALAGWDGWRYYFYDPENPADTGTYYVQLKAYIDILTSLKRELIDIRSKRLPVCQEGIYDTVNPLVCNVCASACDVSMCTGPGCSWSPYLDDGTFYWHCVSLCSACVLNPPCRLSIGGGTIDTNSDDEFIPAIDAIDDLIGRMADFRNEIKRWSDEMDSYIVEGLSDLGGFNPITYSWEDMRGQSRVVVQAGPFQMPKIKKEKHGNFLMGKVCLVLKNYEDQDRCWIKVSKYPPTNVSLGALGIWNPFARGVSKVSKAYYTVEKVGLQAKDLNKGGKI